MQHTEVKNWITVVVLLFRRVVACISNSTTDYAVRYGAVCSAERSAMLPRTSNWAQTSALRQDTQPLAFVGI
jgi:hypothetical protein